jgi:predicted aspartyl protease
LRSQHPYDPRYEPPAPVLPLRVSPPTGESAVGLVALLDTGADLSVIPEAVVRLLGLPFIAQLRIRGVGGLIRPASVYAAKVELNGFSTLCEVVGLGDEALIGRNLLNQWTLALNGPHQVLELC